MPDRVPYLDTPRWMELQVYSLSDTFQRCEIGEQRVLGFDMRKPDHAWMRSRIQFRPLASGRLKTI